MHSPTIASPMNSNTNASTAAPPETKRYNCRGRVERLLICGAGRDGSRHMVHAGLRSGVNGIVYAGFSGPCRTRRQAYVFGICLEVTMPDQRHVKLFRNGRNQAVRIPVEFELPGDEAVMHRDGDRLVIEPVRKRGLIALLATMKSLNEDFPDIEDRPPTAENVF
jgi:antitoxin VapB